MPKTILQSGDRVKIISSGIVATVDVHNEQFTPPVFLRGDDRIYFPNELHVLFPGDLGFSEGAPIKSETHDDNFVFEVPFDSQDWFLQASDKEIIDLVLSDGGVTMRVMLWPNSLMARIHASLRCFPAKVVALSAASTPMTLSLGLQLIAPVFSLLSKVPLLTPDCGIIGCHEILPMLDCFHICPAFWCYPRSMCLCSFTRG